jgi:hypothetical protein
MDVYIYKFHTCTGHHSCSHTHKHKHTRTNKNCAKTAIYVIVDRKERREKRQKKLEQNKETKNERGDRKSMVQDNELISYEPNTHNIRHMSYNKKLRSL